MDVAFVTNVVYPFVPGGAQKRVHEIGTRLADRGHDVTVYARHQWDGPREITHGGMCLRAVADDRELYAGSRRSIREALEFAGRLFAPLRRQRHEHDVVVASVFPYFPVLTAAASLGTSVPVVTTWHEVWQDYWHDYLGRLGAFGAAVERAVAAVPQHPVAVSERTADRLAEFGVDRSDIAVVPNGVDTGRVRSVEPAADGHDVLFVGRLGTEKNVDRLVRAFDRVDDDVTLGIVGDGPERRAVERAVEAAERANAVELVGQLGDHDDVLALMRAADVFVSPSTREGFGLAVLEARAADCRVVAARHDRSVVADVLDDDDVVVAPTEPRLAAGLERALADGVDPTQRGGCHEYDWDRIADRAERVYRRAVDGG